MYNDKELILEILHQIKHSLDVVLYRFEPIREVSDFTSSSRGMEKLDSICMQLIAIGESVKKIDKITEGQLFLKYPSIEWKGVKGMRDIISHHYFDVDAEIIYETCKHKIPELKGVIKRILDDI